MGVSRAVATIAATLGVLVGAGVHAAPVTVAGFTYDDGLRAFADDAFQVSGSLRLCGETVSVSSALSGPDLFDCVNSADSAGAFVEVVFTDNGVVNGAGADLVIYELSGPLSPGAIDDRERFGVSVFDGVDFPAFQLFSPVDTGFRTTGGVNPEGVFAVQVDLTDFGFATGSTTQRLRLHIFNVNLGTKSGDITALGALNSAEPVPEASPALLLILPMLSLSWRLTCPKDRRAKA